MAKVCFHPAKDLSTTNMNKVYNVAKFIEDHPGGVTTLLEVAGTDATTAYEDVGHSEDAREILSHFLIGSCPDSIVEQPQRVQTRHLIQSGSTTSSIAAKDKVAPRHTLVIYGTFLGSIFFLSYEAYVRNPKVGWLHFEQGGFWKGVLVTSAIGLSLLVALTLHVQHLLQASKSDRHPPQHIKPKYEVAHASHAPFGSLSPREYLKFSLIQKTQLSHDSYHFVLALPSPNAVLGLPIGQHIAIRATIDDKKISRSYTPTSSNRDLGRLELTIKLYPDGRLTNNYLRNLQIGDQVEIRGPSGAMRYRKGMCERIGMIAGGTGITPMYQIIRAVCEDETDTTTVSLLYGNKTYEDILLREELERFAAKYPDKFKVWHLLSSPPKEWKYGKGRITTNLIKERLPQPKQGAKILVCGPPGLCDGTKKSLVELGFEKPGAVSKINDQVFFF